MTESPRAATRPSRASARPAEIPSWSIAAEVRPMCAGYPAWDHLAMRISIAADEVVGVAGSLATAVIARGHEVVALHGALNDGERDDWAWASEAAARDVAEGRADQAVVACWTGTGASIAANKVDGVRAVLCDDTATADGAREWNDANVLALSLRLLEPTSLDLILDAWFAGSASTEDD